MNENILSAKITAVCNQKGGVGKTTFTVNIGKNLASLGKRVLLIDNDPQGNLTQAIVGLDVPESIRTTQVAVGVASTLGLYSEEFVSEPYKATELLHLFGATKPLANVAAMSTADVTEYFTNNVRQFLPHYDYILIDCPPTLGNLQVAAFFAAHNYVIPTHLESFSVKGLDDLLGDANKAKRRGNNSLELLGVVINEVDGKLNIAGEPRISVQKHYFRELNEQFDDKVFKVKITRSVKIGESNAMSESINDYSPESQQAKQYMDLTKEFIVRNEVGANGL